MTYLLLGLYIAIIFGISWWFSRSNSDEDFLIAGRNRPMWQILMSKTAVSIGTGFFLIYTGYGYLFGWPITLLLVFQILSAVVFAYWVVPQVYRYARQKSFLTMGDFVGHKLGHTKAGAYMDLMTAGVGFLWIVGTFIGGVKVTAVILSITYERALVLTILLIGTYILISGYRVVLATDVVQFAVVIGLLVIMFFTLYNSVDVASVASTPVETLPITLIIGIAVFGFFTIFGTADRYQLIYSAKSEQAAKHGLLGSVIPFSLAFVPLVFIGLYMQSVAPGLDPDTVFLSFITDFTTPLVASIAGVMLVAGLMSTADSWVYALASHLATARNKLRFQPAPISVTTLRQYIVGSLIMMAVTAFFFRGLLEISIFGAAMVTALSVPMLYVLSNGLHPARFIFALSTALISVIAITLIIGIIPEIILAPIFFGALALLVPVSGLRKIRL